MGVLCGGVAASLAQSRRGRPLRDASRIAVRTSQFVHNQALGSTASVSMRIISFNANGLRSAASKGFFDWFAAQDADVLCVQETKAQEHQLAGPEFLPKGYKAWFRDASTKKDYS